MINQYIIIYNNKSYISISMGHGIYAHGAWGMEYMPTSLSLFKNEKLHESIKIYKYQVKTLKICNLCKEHDKSEIQNRYKTITLKFKSP